MPPAPRVLREEGLETLDQCGSPFGTATGACRKSPGRPSGQLCAPVRVCPVSDVQRYVDFPLLLRFWALRKAGLSPEAS